MKRFVTHTYPPCWVLKARIQKHRASPYSFTISVLGSFTCITQHTGPTALRPIQRTKQLWLSVLLKDTSAATGQAGIRAHILATPELESNALDRSATTAESSTYFIVSLTIQIVICLHANVDCDPMQIFYTFYVFSKMTTSQINSQDFWYHQ